MERVESMTNFWETQQGLEALQRDLAARRAGPRPAGYQPIHRKTPSPWLLLKLLVIWLWIQTVLLGVAALVGMVL